MKKIKQKIKNILKNMFNAKGFTLLELLVVVLIIGVLATIALPQYRKSVEKAKLSEALMNFKAIKDSADRYILANGFPNTMVRFSELPLDIELSGGEFSNYEYRTKNYRYWTDFGPNGYEVEIYTISDTNYYILIHNSRRSKNECWDGSTEMGQYICHYLESQGWEYHEGDY